MPAVSGDRFSNFNLTDCAFCPASRRSFRTGRACGQCGQPLCIVCRPWVPRQPYLCPDCGGGELEDALHHPEASVRKRADAGQLVPFWLTVLTDRMRQRAEDPEEILVPE